MKKHVITATLVSLFLLGGMTFTPEAKADPLDKKSPKIAHGIYREIDKSSPKIAEGMYRDRGKSSPKIAHGIRVSSGQGRARIRRLIDMVDMALEMGEVDLAEELVDEVLGLEYGFFGR